MGMGARKSLPVEEDVPSAPHLMKEMLDENHLIPSRRDREFTIFLDLSQDYHNEFISLLREYVVTYGFSWQELKDSGAERRKCAERFTADHGDKYWGSEESRKKYLSAEALEVQEELCMYPAREEEITRTIEILLERKAKQYCKSADKPLIEATELPDNKTPSANVAVRKPKRRDDRREHKEQKAKNKTQDGTKGSLPVQDNTVDLVPSRTLTRAKTPAPRDTHQPKSAKKKAKKETEDVDSSSGGSPVQVIRNRERAKTPGPRDIRISNAMKTKQQEHVIEGYPIRESSVEEVPKRQRAKSLAPSDIYLLKSAKRKAQENSSDESSVEWMGSSQRAQTVAQRDINLFKSIADPEQEAPLSKKPGKKQKCKRTCVKPGMGGSDGDLPAPFGIVEASSPIRVESKYEKATTFLVSASNQQMAPVWVPFQSFISVSAFLEHLVDECRIPEVGSPQAQSGSPKATTISDKITSWQSNASIPVVVAASVTFPWSGFSIRVRQGKDQDLEIVMEELEKSWKINEENQDSTLPNATFRISVMLHFIG
ncbi:hypothetical protein FE257_011056 [Aspergillus nanangensis]|uniref:Uncharacterized protein n=1 Tax=Aspergillus nanangensis TaxID=2582783 RepID=A0AAD4CHY0_ASPNN|nr:hypothetical protein FE257_011056 [Aspergillus nanangensis]